jgi:hypothetical protein
MVGFDFWDSTFTRRRFDSAQQRRTELSSDQETVASRVGQGAAASLEREMAAMLLSAGLTILGSTRPAAPLFTRVAVKTGEFTDASSGVIGPNRRTSGDYGRGAAPLQAKCWSVDALAKNRWRRRPDPRAEERRTEFVCPYSVDPIGRVLEDQPRKWKLRLAGGQSAECIQLDG